MSRGEWLARQLLPPSSTLSIHEVVARAGWLHTAGGTGPYLSLMARIPGLKRQQVDEAAFVRFEVVEVPAVRDCTMLVPSEDVGLALAAGRGAFEERFRKLGIARKDVDPLCERIAKGLEGGAVRTIGAIRAELPPSIIRELGENGRKLGFATTLPVAMRLLQLDGRVLRIGEDRRLDARRYVYRAFSPPAAPPDPDRALAERFASWASPATAEDFAFFAKRTTALPAVPPVPPARATGEPVFLPFRDNYTSLHRDVAALIDDGRATLLDWKNREVPAKSLQSLHQNTIVVEGAIRGVWEYDADEERVVLRTFGDVPGVDEAAAKLTTFIRDQLGDHKYYALDNAKSRAPRLAFVKGES